MNFDIIGACYDGAGKLYGTRIGPQALRLAGLEKTFQELGIPFQDQGDVNVRSRIIPGEEIKGLEWGAFFFPKLTEKVRDSLKNNNCPVIIGGDHAISIATITAALDHFNPQELGVLWIDAHADINTPNTSPSGDLHGMPLALLSQIKGEWKQAEAIFPIHALLPENIAWLGLRDVDAGEKTFIAQNPKCFVASSNDFTTQGVTQIMKKLEGWMQQRNIKKLWVSFDIDVVDAPYVPGTGTPVPNGLALREVLEIANELKSNYLYTQQQIQIVGIDVVEVNPIIDEHNQTAKLALNWLSHLLGTPKASVLSDPEEGEIRYA